jgi:putative membrane protein
MSSETYLEARLHVAAIAILAIDALRENLLPILVVLVVTGSSGGLDAGDLLNVLWVVPLFGVLGAAAGAYAWGTTTYSLDEDAVTLRSGMLSTKETTVPLERVQSLDELKGPLHRLFGVVRVDVQTAGGESGGEVSLAAVGPDVVAALRHAVAAAGGAPLEAEERGPSRRLGHGALLVAALTSGRLGVLLPVVAVLPQVLDDLVFGSGEEKADPSLLVDLAPGTVAEGVTIGAVVVGAALLLSALGVIVAFAGFEVERASDRLLIRRGLLQRRAATVPVARVQAVRVVEGLLRQPFRLATVRVEVAGYAGEEAAAQTLFPLLPRAAVDGLLRELLPEMAAEIGPLRPSPRRALRRYVLPPALVALLLGGGGVAALESLIPLALVLPAAVAGALAHRAAGWQARGGFIALRFRRLARTTLIGPARLTQGHSVRQSPLQRRAALADFEIALGAAGKGRVRHLEQSDAWAAWRAATAA